MASTASTTKLSGILASLSETLATFQTEAEEFESEFFDLVEGIAELVPANLEDAHTGESSAVDSIAFERLENLDRSIAEQREAFTEKQDRLSEDVGQLRDLFDRQVQLFTTLINTPAKRKRGTASRKGSQKNASEDAVLNDVFAQFEELRGAAAAVSENSTT